MKQIIFCGILSCLFVTSFGQVTQSPNREYYITKSKNQKTAAKVLLIGGGALIATSIIILAPGNTSFDNIPGNLAFAEVGVVGALCSIPLFIASNKNKQKGMALSANINLHKSSSLLSQPQMLSQVNPVLTIKIYLNR